MRKLFPLLLIAALAASCDTGSKFYRSSSYNRVRRISPSFSDFNAGSDKRMEVGPMENISDKINISEQRVVIYDARLDLTVKRPDTANMKLAAIAKKYEGYVQGSGTESAIIRVKASHLNEAIADIAKLGKLTYKNIYGDDVTDEYHDLNMRLENAEKARARYLELLAKAQNVDETLKVEKELERLNGEIDLLKGKIGRIAHLSEFSTITIEFTQKHQPGMLGYVGIGVYKVVKWLFVWN